MQRQDLVIRSSKITWEDLAKDKLTALVEDCSKHAEKQTSSLQIPYFNTKFATEPHGLRHSEISSPGMEKNENIRYEIKLTIVSVGQTLYIIVRTEAAASSLVPDPMEEQKHTLTTNLSK